jgi:hypothetical protein
MKYALAAVFIVGSLLGASRSDAGGMGRFLGALLARGAVVAATSPSTSSSAATKSYTPDTLTVAQLAQCIKKAGKLDDDSSGLETGRADVQAMTAQVDLSSSTIENQRGRVNQRSQASVDSFNALVERHNALVANAKAKQSNFNQSVDAHNIDVGAYNTDCAKKYYADDLAAAQKLAAN